jgi:hypothetical protein
VDEHIPILLIRDLVMIQEMELLRGRGRPTANWSLSFFLPDEAILDLSPTSVLAFAYNRSPVDRPNMWNSHARSTTFHNKPRQVV